MAFTFGVAGFVGDRFSLVEESVACYPQPLTPTLSHREREQYSRASWRVYFFHSGVVLNVNPNSLKSLLASSESLLSSTLAVR